MSPLTPRALHPLWLRALVHGAGLQGAVGWGAAPTDTPRPAGVPPVGLSVSPLRAGVTGMSLGGPMHLLPPLIPNSSVHPFPRYSGTLGSRPSPPPRGHPPLAPLSSDMTEAPQHRCPRSAVPPCLSFPASGPGGGSALWPPARDGTPAVGTVPPRPPPCARLDSRPRLGRRWEAATKTAEQREEEGAR